MIKGVFKPIFILRCYTLIARIRIVCYFITSCPFRIGNNGILPTVLNWVTFISKVIRRYIFRFCSIILLTQLTKRFFKQDGGTFYVTFNRRCNFNGSFNTCSSIYCLVFVTIGYNQGICSVISTCNRGIKTITSFLVVPLIITISA